MKQCPNCQRQYTNPLRTLCDCGATLVNVQPLPPTRPPRTTSGWMNETVHIQMGGRPWGLRRTYLLVFVLIMLLLLLCCCLTYTDVLAAPRFITNILGAYTPLAFGCGGGILFFIIVYFFLIILRLDINCIYVPAFLILLVVLCVIVAWLGWLDLPDFVDDAVDEFTDPIRVLPLPWPFDPEPDTSQRNRLSVPGGCCVPESETDVSGVTQFRDGLLYTEFYIHFPGCTPVRGGQCLQGNTTIGVNQTRTENNPEPWVDVTCCADTSLDDVLRCTTDGYPDQDQVKSWVWVEFDSDCPFEVGFQGLFQVEDPPPVKPPRTTEDEEKDKDKKEDEKEDDDSFIEPSCPLTECGPCCGSCIYDTDREENVCYE